MVVHGAKLSFLQHKIYVYELWTGLYMLEPWEKTLFNTAVAVATTTSCYVMFNWLQAM